MALWSKPVQRLGAVPEQGQGDQQARDWPIESSDVFREAQGSRREVPGRSRTGPRGVVFRDRVSISLETGGQDRERGR